MRLFVWIAISVSVTVVASGNHCPSVSNPDYLPKIIEARRHLQKWQLDNKTPGMVVGVSVNGKPVWLEAFGYSDVENGVRMRLETSMRIASISKTFTGVFAAKLVDEGRLDLDVPIQDYLGEEALPRKQWQGEPVNITTRLLLQHSAGIRAADSSRDRRRIFSPKNQFERIAPIRNDDLIFAPGTNWTYSNWGVEVAAAVVESIIEKDYVGDLDQFIQKELNLKNTFIESSRLSGPRSRYYKVVDDAWHLSELNESMVAIVSPFAGGLVSTAEDLLVYGNLLLNVYKDKSGLLRSATLKQFWKANPLATEELFRDTKGEEFYEGMSYGMVFTNQTFTDSVHPSGRSNVGHVGGMPGIATYFTVYPESDIVVAFLANRGGYEFRPNLQIADIFAASSD